MRGNLLRRRRAIRRWFLVLAVPVGMVGGLSWSTAGGLRADVIASWNFNDRDLIVDQGQGSLTTNFPAADLNYLSGSTRNALEGVTAGQALVVENKSNNGLGRLDFTLDTRGYAGLTMSFATQRTATGFNLNQVSYSSDGGLQFSDWGAAYSPPSGSFGEFAYDFSTLLGLDENAAAVIRITFGGATSGSGNNRLDNVQFQANSTLNSSSTPEAPAWALTVVVPILGWLRRRVTKR